MTPWSIAARRRHSFMPSTAPSPRPVPDPQTPNSPDTIVPTIESSEEAPARESVVSLDRHRERDGRKQSDMLAVPEGPSRGGSKRFSLLRFRHASDSQLNQTAKQHAEAPPPLPPAIMRTAPTSDDLEGGKRRSTFLLSRRPKTPKRNGKGRLDHGQPGTPRLTMDGNDVDVEHAIESPGPPSYDDASTLQLAVPTARVSDSSRSDGSSRDETVYGQTTTVTHTTHTTTTFFKLPSRRKKDKGPLFPLPPRSTLSTPRTGNTPNLAPTGFGSERTSFSFADGSATPTGSPQRSVQHSPSRSTPNAAPSLARSNSKLSAHSTHSARQTLQARGRSSTAGSARRFRRDLERGPTPPVPSSGRTSTSTAGRPSLAGLFNMTRIRQASEPALRNGASAPGTPMSVDSNPMSAPPKSPSITLPERQEGDTPAKYLERLEDVFTRAALVPVISKTDDEFMRNVLRSYMRRFKFFEEPIDMAVRKLLMQVELPKETQQIDRTLQAFAHRYHECNPGIFQAPDEAYFIAFSILILHTDVFNKNNKRKMQKQDYLKNTQSQAVAPEILACFYDNVAYTPFIHLDDETDFLAERALPKRRKGPLKSSSTPSLGRNHGQPVDPYALILDGKLDMLRVPVDDVVAMDDPFGYLGTAKILHHTEMRRAFHRNGILQIVSSRSRPDAFATEATIHNPSEAQVGIIDMKITKVGVLWRKDPKKRKTRSPWQEWGAILTGAQLYFFRDKDWIKSLIHQYDSHLRAGRGKTPCVFKPAITNLKPDFLVSTEGMVALVDSDYRRHKNAFVLSRDNIFQEVLLADNESDLNDWLAKLNYLAAFKTTGVRMRGITGGSSADSTSLELPQMARPQSGGTTSPKEDTDHAIPSPAAMETANEKLARQISEARRKVLRRTLEEMEGKLMAIDRQLDTQLSIARHLAVLTPIQERTRLDVLNAAAKLASNIRWERMKRWRIRCHRDILHIDLDEDLKQEASGLEPTVEDPVAPSKSKGDRSRLGFGRFNSKTGTATPSKSSSRDDRSNMSSPTSTTKFVGTVEELFKAPSRAEGSKHGPKGSWELPPLTFDRPDSGVNGSAVSSSRGPSEADDSVLESSKISGTQDEIEATASGMDPSTPVALPHDSDKRHSSGTSLKPPPSVQSEIRADDDVISTTDTEAGSTPRPKRHSLQKRLHSGNGPTFHRHRKHRGSSSTAGASDTDGTGALAPEEALLRSPGSFTLHGKKASVVTFGSEWKNMSAEEGLRARKMTLSSDETPLNGAAQERSQDTSEATIIPTPAKTAGGDDLEKEDDLTEFQDVPETSEVQVHAGKDDVSEPAEGSHNGKAVLPDGSASMPVTGD